ncbi:hypothetical protein G4G28_09925 [Massilia sp. Dwa41.01b]|uniref:hypothetical protein n=1 Tax=unclassified Massilia TaxID=2609279 RepID=UPI0016027C62|nr:MULTISPECIES: hypothetical protein [unclassified Massilia]QNA88735.1 hypothetical protein G4G28_09925 [Massilia sp. Dwa41.01b]
MLNVHAAPPPGAASQYRLLDLAACRKPAAVAPALPGPTFEAYGAQRRLLNLDGSGRCVLMDFWIARLGGSESPGMRVLEHRFMRVVHRKWQPFDTPLRWYPFAVQERRSGKTYLVDVPTEEDLDDFMVLKTGVPRVFTVTGWVDQQGFVSELALQEVTEGRADILRALSVLLETRAISGRAAPAAERARIRALRDAANAASPSTSP